MAKLVIPYKEAKKYIKDADVLLFQAPPFPSIGFWITRYTGGIHSHVALAHWSNNRLMCVEQREFKGGRSVVLKSQVAQHPNRIDVYRAKPHVTIPEVSYEDGHLGIKLVNTKLGDQRCKAIIDTALDITGQPYGWKNIWKIFVGYAPLLRLARSNKNGDMEVSDCNVCSTLGSYAFRINYADPVPGLKDARTSPADLERSFLFDYLFTIGD